MKTRFVAGLVVASCLLSGCSGSSTAAPDPAAATQGAAAGANPVTPNVSGPVNTGLAALQKGTAAGYVEARDAFTQAFAQIVPSDKSNQADVVRFFYALTRVGAFPADLTNPTQLNATSSNNLKTVGALLTAAGFDTASRTSYKALKPPARFPDSGPTGDDLTVFFLGPVQQELNSAVAALSLISPTFQVTWNFNATASFTGGQAIRQVVSDYGDVLALRSSCHALRAGFLEAASYDLGEGVADYLNNTDRSIQGFLSINPLAGFIAENAPLATVRQECGLCIDDFIAGVAFIRARPNKSANYLLTITASTANVDRAVANAAKFKTYLTSAGPTRATDGSTANLDLPTYFTSRISLRTFAPPFNKNRVNGLFPGSPFTPIYTGFTAGTQADPNRSTNGRGTPDFLK